MVRAVSFALALTLLSGAGLHAAGIQTCSSTEAEQELFLRSRVEPMTSIKPLVASEQWVLLVAGNPEGSALKLSEFCKKHPRIPLAVAFQTLFNGD